MYPPLNFIIFELLLNNIEQNGLLFIRYAFWILSLLIICRPMKWSSISILGLYQYIYLYKYIYEYVLSLSSVNKNRFYKNMGIVIFLDRYEKSFRLPTQLGSYK